MSVVPFPGKKKAALLRERLNERIQELQYLYDTLNRCHEIMNKVEYDANCIEHEYNSTLAEYVKEVGAENLEVGYLEYSTEALVQLKEDGTFTVTFQDYEYEETP